MFEFYAVGGCGQVFLNRRYTSIRINCITSQKTASFTITGVGNLISKQIVFHVIALTRKWLHATIVCTRSCRYMKANTHWATVSLEMKCSTETIIYSLRS